MGKRSGARQICDARVTPSNASAGFEAVRRARTQRKSPTHEKESSLPSIQHEVTVVPDKMWSMASSSSRSMRLSQRTRFGYAALVDPSRAHSAVGRALQDFSHEFGDLFAYNVRRLYAVFAVHVVHSDVQPGTRRGRAHV